MISTEDKIPVVRGKLLPQVIFEITKEELEIFKRYTSNSLFVNFGMVFLTTAISTTITWLTLEDISSTASAVMVGVIFTGYLGGVLLLGLWWYSRSDHKKKIAEIGYLPHS